MKRLILSGDTLASDNEFVKYANALKNAHSEVWGSIFKYVQYKPNIEGRHSNWARIPLLHKFLDSFDEILWLDSDVIITNNHTSIFENFYSNLTDELKPPFAKCCMYGNNKSCSAVLFDCRDKVSFKQFLNDWWNDADENMCKNFDIAIVWNTVWHNNTKKNYVHSVQIDVSNHKNSKLIKVDEKYRLLRGPIIKKHYWQMVNKPHNKRIAIVIREQNFYSNGVGQNCIFLRHSFEAAGFNIDFVTNGEKKIISSELPYEILAFNNLILDDYILFIFGSQTLTKQNCEKVRSNGIHCVMFNPCNVIDQFHAENFLYSEKKANIPLFENTFHTFSDEVWVTSNHKDTSLEYLEVINRGLVQVKPITLTWAPLFLEKDGVMPSYIQRNINSQVDFVIIEPNLGYCKSAWIPLIICEKFYQTYPERLNKVYLFNAPEKNPTAMGMIKSLKIGEDNKIKMLGRLPINDILTFFSNPAKNNGNHVIFISHSINSPLNYAYFDILYSGFPFIHNSPSLKNDNIGFFYDSINSGVEKIQKIFCDYNVSDSLKVNHYYLSKIDPYNEMIINEFKKLVKLEEKKSHNFQFICVTASPQRREIVEKQLDIICKEAPRYFIEPDDPPSYLEGNTYSIMERRIIYCTRSHYKALDLASQKTSPEFSIILEDDVSFHKKDFLELSTKLMNNWEHLMGDNNMASIGWVPCHNYESYLPKNKHIYIGIKQYKLLNDRYNVGTQAYIVRRKDLGNYVNNLLKNHHDEHLKAIRENYKFLNLNADDLIACDKVLPRILGQMTIFPPIAIEHQTHSLLGHTQQYYWEKYFKNYEYLRSNYFSFNDFESPRLLIEEEEENLNFTPIVIYVNEDRHKHMINQIKIFGSIQTHFYKGFTPKDCESYMTYRDPKIPEYDTTLSCTRSHIGALKYFLENSSEQFALIMEDDILLRKDFMIKLKEIIEVWKKHEDIDFVSLGYQPNEHKSNKTDGELNWDLNCKNGCVWGALAYLVKREVAKDMVKWLDVENTKKLYDNVELKEKTNNCIYSYKGRRLTIDHILSICWRQGFITNIIAIESPLFISSIVTSYSNSNTRTWNKYFRLGKLKVEDFSPECEIYKSQVQIIVITCSNIRKVQIKKQLEELKIYLPVKYLEGWTPASCVEYLPKDKSMEVQRHICCTRSHISALEIASNSDYEYTIIMEDDANIHKTKFMTVVNEIIEKWQTLVYPEIMASIGWIPGRPYKSYIENSSTGSLVSLPESRIFKNFLAWGTQAYIVRKKDIGKFIPIFKKSTFQEFVESIQKEKFKHINKEDELTNVDNTLNRILGQAIFFPQVVIESLSPSCIRDDNFNKNCWMHFFKNYESKRNDYFFFIDEALPHEKIVQSDEDLLKPIVISYENTDTNEGAKLFESTLKNNNWQYKIIGGGEKWEGFISKIRGYYGALERLNPQKIVVLSDARDVFCMRGPNTFLKNFKKYSKPIVVSMEIFCDGVDFYREDKNDKLRQCMNLAQYWKYHKMEPPERRFVNAGLIAGYATDLKHMFGWILENKFSDDQFGVGNYILNFPEKIATDHQAKLLHTSTFGVNAGLQYLDKQAEDSPTLAELNGYAAYFLHIPGLKIKGQKLIYSQVKEILSTKIVKPLILTSAYGFEEPGMKDFKIF